MLIFYLACLIFGGGLLAFSLLMGGDHSDSADAHHSLDFHGDVEHPQIEVHKDISHLIDTDNDISDGHHSLEVQHDGDLTHSHPETVHVDKQKAGDAVKLISFRNIIYFIAFFGLTGTVLDYMAINAALTFLSSSGMGIISAIFGYKFMKYLKDTESGEATNIADFKGKPAKVVLQLSKDQLGKVKLEVAAQTTEIPAKASEIAKKDFFNVGDNVLIIEIKNNTAYIVETDLLQE